MLKGLQLGPRAVKRGVKAGMAGASRMADCLVPRTAAATKDQELLARPDEVEADGLVTLVIALSQVGARLVQKWGRICCACRVDSLAHGLFERRSASANVPLLPSCVVPPIRSWMCASRAHPSW